MLEILAPSGNEECAEVAIGCGANAIYLGYTAFSARDGAGNFDDEALKRIIRKAHFAGVKIYVAMNTLVKTEETDVFLETLLRVWNMGADAIILQDIFLGKYVHALYPQIVLHLSTQAGICTEAGARLAKEYGFSRVILARETPLSEIEKITKILETEVFVQGALCTCFSGQCYFSSFAGGNSGNRGRCKQPCRKKYSYNRAGFEEKAYALSLSDLSVGEDVNKLIDAGVVSFKIEGRMRRKEYVGAAIRYYKAVLQGNNSHCELSDLKRTYNRGNYTKGLAFGQDKRFLSRAVQGHIGEKVGVVKVENGKFAVESAFHARQGDAFKILRDGIEVGGAAYAGKFARGFFLFSKLRLKNGDSVFVTTDNEVNERVVKAEQTLYPVRLKLRFVLGEEAYAEGDGVKLKFTQPLQKAINGPLTSAELMSNFSKTDGMPIKVEFESVETSGDVFLPKSALNAFRREFYALLAQKVAVGERAPLTNAWSIPKLSGCNSKLAVISDDFSSINCDVAIYKP
ncbi:MAG: U32 family peptidase, partial [Clostridia bacterium]|nr:U32 family peptidase [Clostridia bacterium]